MQAIIKKLDELITIKHFIDEKNEIKNFLIENVGISFDVDTRFVNPDLIQLMMHDDPQHSKLKIRDEYCELMDDFREGQLQCTSCFSIQQEPFDEYDIDDVVCKNCNGEEYMRLLKKRSLLIKDTDKLVKKLFQIN